MKPKVFSSQIGVHGLLSPPVEIEMWFCAIVERNKGYEVHETGKAHYKEIKRGEKDQARRDY